MVESAGRLGVLMAAAVLLTGFQACPLQGDETAAAGAPTSGGADLGGSQGARWQVELAEDLLVTLRVGSAVASASTDGRLPVEVMGQLVDVGTFCWRPDVACPQHVLAEHTVVAQPEGAAQAVLLAFNRRGPLAGHAASALVGKLDGRELSVPLPTAGSEICGLRAPSAILATARGPEASADREANEGVGPGPWVADELEGRIGVAYGGACAAASGAAMLVAEDRIEISARFRARREH